MTPEQIEEIVQVEWKYHQKAAEDYWMTRGDHTWEEDNSRELADDYYSDCSYSQFKAWFISDRGLDAGDQNMEIAA